MAGERQHAPRAVTPTTFSQASMALKTAAADGRAVRFAGAGTKRGWGAEPRDAVIEVRTKALNRVLEHNAGDLTAILEAGVPVAKAQELFGAAGQMLALDPPLARTADGAPDATIGGLVATGDSGPRRHRYGAPRDLVIGITVALGDGTIARAGGKVIKNVAGYDLPKLFAGSFGTLGLILSVSVRLHPIPAATATAFAAGSDPDLLARAARALAAAPLELESLDLAWRGGRGGLLARAGGKEAGRRAERVARLLREQGLEHADVTTDDDHLWARQRAGQRSVDNALVRVSARPSALAAVLRAADASGGTLVGRAALGTSYVEVEPEAVVRLRGALPAGSATVVLDHPASADVDVWGHPDGPGIDLMRRVKARFDPAGVCNPGLFVGGI